MIESPTIEKCFWAIAGVAGAIYVAGLLSRLIA